MEVAFGLVGGILGFLLASSFQIWQRVLDGQAAARLIRVESIANRTRIMERAPQDHLNRQAWASKGSKIVPFLDELDLMRIGESYAEMARIGLLIEIEARRGESENGDNRIADWVGKEQENGRVLRHRIEQAKPWTLAPKLLWPRKVATPEELRTAYGLDEEQPSTRELLAQRRAARNRKAQRGDEAISPDEGKPPEGA